LSYTEDEEGGGASQKERIFIVCSLFNFIFDFFSIQTKAKQSKKVFHHFDGE
jgi:hypothetical protein